MVSTTATYAAVRTDNADDDTARAPDPAAPPGLNAAPKGGTYVLKDPEAGEIVRTGRTTDLERRRKEHARAYPDMDFDVDAQTDDRDEQRGREQYLHEKYKPSLNKIGGVYPKNKNRQRYEEAGKRVKGKY